MDLSLVEHRQKKRANVDTDCEKKKVKRTLLMCELLLWISF